MRRLALIAVLIVAVFTRPAFAATNEISGNFSNGAILVGAGAACNGGNAGGLRYNSTTPGMEFCDGSTWRTIAATSVSCGSPSGLSFTDLTGQSLGTSVTSNTATITFTGCSSALSVSVTGAATAQISVNGGAWTTSGAVYSGQTLQVRLTSSNTANTMLTATVTVGSSSTNWHVTSRLGSLKVFLTSGTYIGGTIGGLSAADADLPVRSRNSRVCGHVQGDLV